MMQHVHPTLIQATRTVSEISGNEVLITVSVILINCINSGHGLKTIKLIVIIYYLLT